MLSIAPSCVLAAASTQMAIVTFANYETMGSGALFRVKRGMRNFAAREKQLY